MTTECYGMFGGSQTGGAIFHDSLTDAVDSADGDGSIYLVMEPTNGTIKDNVTRYYSTLGLTVADPEPIRAGEAEITSSVIGLSGGNPEHYIQRLSESREWEAIKRACLRGAALLTSSGSAEALGALARDLADGLTPEAWRPGLRLFPSAFFATHWNGDIDSGDENRIASRYSFNQWLSEGVDDKYEFFGIDEDTGLVGDGLHWRIVGTGQVHRRRPEGWISWDEGDEFELNLLPV